MFLPAFLISFWLKKANGEDYLEFNNTPSFMGKYQCRRCGGWFPKSEIDVDHVIPKRHGGTDDLYNLQALCKHCNRSKNSNVSGAEVAQSVIMAGLSGLADGGINGGLNNLSNLGKSAVIIIICCNNRIFIIKLISMFFY